MTNSILLLFMLLISFRVLAFQVEPLIHSMTDSGTLANATFRVANTGEKPLAIETDTYKRTVSGLDREKLTPADRDFIIMPPMAEIVPGDYQIFRVRYLGSGALEQAQSYRIYFKQLPIEDSSEQGAQVKMLFNLGALVFITPPNVHSNLSAEIKDNDIILTNNGRGVADLSEYTLSIKTSDDSVSLPWQQLSQYGSASYLVPNQATVIPISDWYELKRSPSDIAIAK
ncbi:hypothetical protein BCV08_14525 [Vibrio breoganii]|uniref:fimbrial biogenesis chaperone n=1 Tax=Vibrio breoganii TaxID=553239 RepID=UPI000C8219DC|nr:fimbria/pilus periplasmic chaperone [Vibrio breoganii]PMF83984.1 hypothetical protein BCV08_14525 [Vibrio breoganii]